MQRDAPADDVPDAGQATVLCINRGSSSLKFGLYRVEQGRAYALLAGEAAIDDGRHAGGGESIDDKALQATDAHGVVWRVPMLHAGEPTEDARDPAPAVTAIATLIEIARLPCADVVAHRIVHGGPDLHAHCLVDAGVMASLDAAVPFARLHMPPALALLRAADATFPGVAQVACLDTAFHHDLPDVARVLPIANTSQSLGLRRYGFHGLSCESIVHALGGDVPERTIVAHLGHGASITAIRDARSIDTSMGLTPAGGIVMGTRSGDIDPGLMIHLLRTQPLDAIDVERQLEHESGMFGVSGISGDMRVLHDAAPGSESARLAIAIFCQSACKQIAAMIAVLDGLDLLVFTGGIGEHDPAVRETICVGLRWIGVRLDERHNAASLGRIEGPDSRCDVRVMPSNEDEQMARIAARLIRGKGVAAAGRPVSREAGAASDTSSGSIVQGPRN